MRRGRIVHRVASFSSTCDRVFDDTPIFMTRLSDDNGDRMTVGAPPTAASRRPVLTFLHELTCHDTVGAAPED